MGRRWSGLVVVLLLLVACSDTTNAGVDSGSGPVVDGGAAQVVEVEVPGRGHVLGEVSYPTSPPAGGDHFFFWQNCGFYDTPLIDEVAVHSLEHGAVWVTYLPDVDPDVLAEIELVAADATHLLVSPYEGQTSPLVLTAWGRQLAVGDWHDAAVQQFLDDHLGRRSPTAPEAGGACSGAIGNPPSDPTANYDIAVESVQAES